MHIRKTIIPIVLLFFLFTTNTVVSSNNYRNYSTSISEFGTINPNQSPRVVKILNYNLWESGKAGPEWMDLLVSENADIVLLQETGTYSPGESLTSLLSTINGKMPNETPYQGSIFGADAATDGQITLSRYPVLETNVLEVIYMDDGSAWNINHPVLHTVIDLDGVETHIINIHNTCCSGGISSRLKEQEGIINYIDTLGNVPVIYGGDFNSDSPEDVDFEKSSDLGYEPIEMLIDGNHSKSPMILNFTDSYRSLNPLNPGFTFYDTIWNSRLDYIFVSDHLEGALVNSTVLLNYPWIYDLYDHFPITLTLNLDYQIIDLKPPLPIHPFNAEVDTIGYNVNLTWNKSPEIDTESYKIYRNDSLITSVDNNTLFYNDVINSQNQIFEYNIRPIDNSSNLGVESIPVYVNTSYGVLTKPSQPILTVTSLEGSIFLNWTVPDPGGLPIKEYHLFRGLSATGGFNIIEKTTIPEYNETDITPNVEVFYKVLAINELGISSRSDPKPGTLLPIPNTSTPSDETSNSEDDTPVLVEYFIFSLAFTTIIIKKVRSKIEL